MLQYQRHARILSTHLKKDTAPFKRFASISCQMILGDQWPRLHETESHAKIHDHRQNWMAEPDAESKFAGSLLGGSSHLVSGL